ncbi:MAG: hypothetical protein VYA34_01735 [Myxococcota bacterium]|nr:hypothetical protein [Myxococcota bacterium]
MDHTKEDYIDVFCVYNPIELDWLVGVLEDNGVRPIVRDRSLSPFPTPMGTDEFYKIAVGDNQIEKVREIIHEAQAQGLLNEDGYEIG